MKYLLLVLLLSGCASMRLPENAIGDRTLANIVVANLDAPLPPDNLHIKYDDNVSFAYLQNPENGEYDFFATVPNYNFDLYGQTQAGFKMWHSQRTEQLQYISKQINQLRSQ